MKYCIKKIKNNMAKLDLDETLDSQTNESNADVATIRSERW